MKIIDNKKDFYDYLSDRYKDDSIVFDRRGSVIIKKNFITCGFHTFGNGGIDIEFADKNFSYYIILQIGTNFWMFYVNPIISKMNFESKGWKDIVVDSKLELVGSWEDNRAPRELIRLNYFYSHRYKFIDKKPNPKSAKGKDFKWAKDFIHTNGSKWKNGDRFFDGKHELILLNRGKLIIQDTGIPACVNPLDIYLALEEYFSIEKSSTERRESTGLTNNDKIEMHGFNVKDSFRGNNK